MSSPPPGPQPSHIALRAGDDVAAARSGSKLPWLRPLIALLVALPITLYAVACSWRWFAAPFPGMLLMPNAVVTTVSTFEWPPQRTKLFHGRIVAVDGAPVQGSAEVYGAAARHSAGTDVVYTVDKDGERFDLTIPTRRFTPGDYVQTYGLILLVGGTYLVLGLIVGFLQPRRMQARVFLLQALVAGLYPITGVFLHQPEFPLLGRLSLVLECFFGATWLHLALHFPVERRLAGPARALPLLPYAAGTLFAAAVLLELAQDPPRLQALHALYAFNGSCIALFLLGMVYSYWENRTPAARLRIKAVLPGLLAASLLPLFAFLNNAWGGGNFPVQFGLLLIPLLQASVAYAIVKHDLFYIDRIVRLSFTYQLLSVIVIGAYALMLELSSRLLPMLTGLDQTAMVALFLLILAFGLEPLRRAVQALVDRAFYRVRLDSARTIGELSNVMTTLLDLQAIADQVTRVPAESMQLESTHLAVNTGGRWLLWSRSARGGLRPEHEETTAQSLATVARPVEAGFLASALRHKAEAAGEEGAVELLRRTAAAVVLPLLFRGEVVGLLLLGAKRSGQSFGPDDIDMLRTLTNQTAIAVQNARSYSALQELAASLDAKVREQTAALRQAYDDLKTAEVQLVQSEKMASLGQLVAGIAHELNNPASFIHGGLANLQDYLVRLLDLLHVYETMPPSDPAQRAELAQAREHARIDVVRRETPVLLRACNEGSERIAKIVGDLRLFARSSPGDRQLADVRDSIESSLRLLGHRIGAQQVKIVRSFENVPLIPLSTSQIGHVWMNLLSNALDAVEGRPEARIEIRVQSAWLDEDRQRPCVTVAIADNGTGIAAEHQARIFEPFFTTKEVGRGTGLGLSIAYGAVRSHHGTLHVQSKEGAGTTMTVCLPIEEDGRGAE